jgi:hypothetical protein
MKKEENGETIYLTIFIIFILILGLLIFSMVMISIFLISPTPSYPETNLNTTCPTPGRPRTVRRQLMYSKISKYQFISNNTDDMISIKNETMNHNWIEIEYNAFYEAELEVIQNENEIIVKIHKDSDPRCYSKLHVIIKIPNKLTNLDLKTENYGMTSFSSFKADKLSIINSKSIFTSMLTLNNLYINQNYETPDSYIRTINVKNFNFIGSRASFENSNIEKGKFEIIRGMYEYNPIAFKSIKGGEITVNARNTGSLFIDKIDLKEFRCIANERISINVKNTHRGYFELDSQRITIEPILLPKITFVNNNEFFKHFYMNRSNETKIYLKTTGYIELKQSYNNL